MAKKKKTATDTVVLRRLDATGGTVELSTVHASRLLALEKKMNVRNFEPVTDAPRSEPDSDPLPGAEA